MKPCWDAKGNGICQTCGKVGVEDVEVLRALGWHYDKGRTIGGQDYEALLCPHCAKGAHRKTIIKSTLEQDQLPIDWGQYRALPKSQGGHTR